MVPSRLERPGRFGSTEDFSLPPAGAHDINRRVARMERGTWSREIDGTPGSYDRDDDLEGGKLALTVGPGIATTVLLWVLGADFGSAFYAGVAVSLGVGLISGIQEGLESDRDWNRE